MPEAKKTREELIAARAAREAEAAAAQETHDLLCLELEDRFSHEIGKRGAAWEMVNEDNTCDEGPIVVKLGDPTAHKLFMGKAGTAPEDQYAYVAPAVVYPERGRVTEIFTRRPQLMGRACIALTKLYGYSEEIRAGK